MDTEKAGSLRQAHTHIHGHKHNCFFVLFLAHVWCKYLILLAHYITDTDGRTHTLIHTLTLIYTGTY